ncbi:MAG: sulfatase [Gemmataceae bacterium]|nr:sulfatase [Gemmataceae bacterium]
MLRCRSLFSACWLALGALHFTALPLRAGTPKPLNLVIITADDMNADSSGWMGNKLRPTPNLDAFAKKSHRFLNHHVSAPICQPGRQALMTGLVPHRNGGIGFNPINPGVPTLVTVLAARGYFTAVINKIPHMAPAKSFPWDLKLDGSGRSPKAIREQLARCLREARQSKKPFFLNVNITDPHRPFPGSPQEKKLAKKGPLGPVKPYRPDEVTVPSFLEDLPEVRREVAQYFASIRRFDESFGEILAELAASGHLADTLIVFLSDHGMSFPFSKATVYRNGTWSPVVMHWPGMPQAAVHQEMVSSVDLLPTVLAILNVPPPANIDGRSWLPLLRGEKQEGRDHVVTHVNTVSSGKSFAQRCVRTKTRSLMFHAWVDGTTRLRVEAMNGLTYTALAEAAKSDPRIKARVEQYTAGTPLAFYDLERDPDERNNLIRDPRSQAEIERLSGLLIRHMERTSDPQLVSFRAALAKK